jgi:hypothetical protein
MDNAAAYVKAACPSSFDKSIDRTMTKGDTKANDERAARLAQALRANLHRRKAQARAVGDREESGTDCAANGDKAGQ